VERPFGLAFIWPASCAPTVSCWLYSYLVKDGAGLAKQWKTLLREGLPESILVVVWVLI
jgi:hypothetical protein